MPIILVPVNSKSTPLSNTTPKYHDSDDDDDDYDKR